MKEECRGATDPGADVLLRCRWRTRFSFLKIPSRCTSSSSCSCPSSCSCSCAKEGVLTRHGATNRRRDSVGQTMARWGCDYRRRWRSAISGRRARPEEKWGWLLLSLPPFHCRGVILAFSVCVGAWCVCVRQMGRLKT